MATDTGTEIQINKPVAPVEKHPVLRTESPSNPLDNKFLINRRTTTPPSRLESILPKTAEAPEGGPSKAIEITQASLRKELAALYDIASQDPTSGITKEDVRALNTDASGTTPGRLYKWAEEHPGLNRLLKITLGLSPVLAVAACMSTGDIGTDRVLDQAKDKALTTAIHKVTGIGTRQQREDDLRNLGIWTIQELEREAEKPR